MKLDGISIPELALSVRQPWAWALIYAGKDVENRTGFAVRHMFPLTGRRAIHASKGMTKDEYEHGRDFMASLGIRCPDPAALLRGGIIGVVEVTGVVSKSHSPWFFGPRGLVVKNPTPCEFVPASGMLGYFRWKPADPPIITAPARWMLPAKARCADPPPEGNVL